MSEEWPKAKWQGEDFKWFEDVAIADGEAPVYALLRIQADLLRETGTYTRLLVVNPATASAIHLGAGDAVLVRGRRDLFGGDSLDPEPWPMPSTHVAVVTPIHAIAIAVDRSLGPQQGMLKGDGRSQRIVFSS